MNYKVLVTASGVGSRLGELTKNLNKALVKVAARPALSYILESYSKNTEFVITVGYLAAQIKDFVKSVYPDLSVAFAEVDRFDGSGTSMGYSMLQARESLQCPFIIHCCDTLIFDDIPSPLGGNWNAGTPGPSAAFYTSFKILQDGNISKIADKGASSYDLLHIGFVGIKDYELFWESLDYLYKQNPNDSVLNDTRTINLMLAKGAQFRAVKFNTWLDIGNPAALKETDKFILSHPGLVKSKF